jgi:hypothetical protein
MLPEGEVVREGGVVLEVAVSREVEVVVPNATL